MHLFCRIGEGIRLWFLPCVEPSSGRGCICRFRRLVRRRRRRRRRRRENFPQCAYPIKVASEGPRGVVQWAEVAGSVVAAAVGASGAVGRSEGDSKVILLAAGLAELASQ